jgi:serine/threonine protein kinase
MSSFDCFKLNLGSYQFTNSKIIGRGSFSTVYSGINTLTKDKVAIKVIAMNDLNKMQDRLKYEINVMKTLDHTNVIKMCDVIYKDNFVFIILDYCRNGDFHKFLNGRPLKEKYSLFYLKQMSQGLRYLYDRSIIHRDLKPQNLLLDNNYTLKITDFGFAKYFDITGGGMSETICGTPLYMAPEIMKFKKYSIKSDLWSVGVILYEMVVGRTPYKAQNHMELLHRINTEAVIVPIYLDISEGCRQLIRKLLQKNPKDRINWEQFFGHSWLVNGVGGLDISILNSPPEVHDSMLFSVSTNISKEIVKKQFISSSQIKPSDETDTICGIFTDIETKSYSPKNKIINIIDDYQDRFIPPTIPHTVPHSVPHIILYNAKENYANNIMDSEDNEEIGRSEVDSEVNGDEDTEEDYYSCGENWINDNDDNDDNLSISEGDEDVIISTNTVSYKNISNPIPIKKTNNGDSSIGIKYQRGRIISEDTVQYSLQNRRELFLPIVGRTPQKDSGYVVVETPKEYDIVTDIIKNERRNLSESLMDRMSDTYYYLRSFWNKGSMK